MRTCIKVHQLLVCWVELLCLHEKFSKVKKYCFETTWSMDFQRFTGSFLALQARTDKPAEPSSYTIYRICNNNYNHILFIDYNVKYYTLKIWENLSHFYCHPQVITSGYVFRYGREGIFGLIIIRS